MDVILRDFDGNTLSSFWQYGLIDWEMFYSCLRTIIFSPESWAVFRYDENVLKGKGAFYPPSHDVPEPGTYILLCPDGSRISVGLTPLLTRLRHPTISNTPTDYYQTRVRHRDPCCLISRYMVVRGDYSRFKAAHIYPRAHDIEWVRKGYPRRITDPAPLTELGGSTKIDSVQNVILLRGDLHDAWDNYKFAVNPDHGYVVIPFVPGYGDIAGNVLKLDHITDSNLRPLDDLFRDHFLQGVLKNMKGAGEPTWDYEDALGGGTMDLSRSDVWGGKRGREHLEFEMAHRLHNLQAAQEFGF
ncbi:hypothetical protein PILCRDRAFT_822864 [Piloderma croceum F 1598]|uniref:HNH nuclease domain-containing protein n=1 Tax=Piloderma croceum (strain F 1598) TaxID=765440 RepID=A0A0C3FKH1_PILCF|nr:hypothetical protein PILCRDRAFT_822864 [Piloderma croceum F 1598]